MREVDWASGTVAAQPCYWAVMALEHLGDARLTVTRT